jgi:hypothetical protein
MSMEVLEQRVAASCAITENQGGQWYHSRPLAGRVPFLQDESAGPTTLK